MGLKTIGKTVINCQNAEEVTNLISLLADELDLIASKQKSLIDAWKVYGSMVCYNLNDNKSVTYADTLWFRGRSYDIITFQEYLNLQNCISDVITFKKGDIITNNDSPFEELAMSTGDRYGSYFTCMILRKGRMSDSKNGDLISCSVYKWQLVNDMEISLKLKQNE